MESKADAPTKLPTLRDWRAYFRSRGVQHELAEEYLAYIRPLAKRSLPVIYDFHHLAALLGRTPEFLARATSAPEHFYRTFSIPKKSGDLRSIASPYPSLKECQRWVADELLARIPVHTCATAYSAGSSILSNIRPHLSTNCSLLVVDLKDFFPSITKKRLIGWFHSLGYNFEVSIALASLCSLDGRLPQGGPASPLLSNAICVHLDRRLHAIAQRFRLNYTRYADDLCFSGTTIHSGIHQLVCEAVRRSGFSLNEAKTRIYRQMSTSKVVTGVNISSGVPRLPRNRRRGLEHTMHFISTFGYISHKQKLKIIDQKYLLRLRGQLEYWRLLEPENPEVATYLTQVRQLQRLHGDG